MSGLDLAKPDMKRILYNIVILGCGANGSHFIRGLLQDLDTHLRDATDSMSRYRNDRFGVILTIVDGDKIEKKNLGNQIFTMDEVGEFKASSLAERYGTHYGFEVNAVTEYVTQTVLLETLFSYPEVSESTQVIPLLVGMVDNNRTRQLMDEFFRSDFLEDIIYIDAGVDGVEQTGDDANTGFGGQIVVGLKFCGDIWLEPVGGVYREVLEDTVSVFPDQSCGAAIIENPQRCATNKLAAQIVNNVTNNLFHQHKIFAHVINFNAQLCMVQPQLVSRQVERDFNSNLKGSEENEVSPISCLPA